MSHVGDKHLDKLGKCFSIQFISCFFSFSFFFSCTPRMALANCGQRRRAVILESVLPRNELSRSLARNPGPIFLFRYVSLLFLYWILDR